MLTRLDRFPLKQRLQILRGKEIVVGNLWRQSFIKKSRDFHYHLKVMQITCNVSVD